MTIDQSQDRATCHDDAEQKFDRRDTICSLALITGVTALGIAMRRDHTKESVEVAMSKCALLQNEIQAGLSDIPGYKASVFEREDGGYNINIQSDRSPVNHFDESSGVADIDDSCFSKIVGRILKLKREFDVNSIEPIALTVSFDFPKSKITNRSIGVFERLKTGGIRVEGISLGNGDLDDIASLPEFPELDHINISGTSVPDIIRKFPHVRSISTGTAEDVELPEDIVKLLMDNGRESIRINGSEISF